MAPEPAKPKRKLSKAGRANIQFGCGEDSFRYLQLMRVKFGHLELGLKSELQRLPARGGEWIQALLPGGPF